jgi:hypothetical protein
MMLEHSSYKYYNDYQIYQENVEMFGIENVQKNQDVKLFENAREELNNIGLNEVKELLNQANVAFTII